MLGQVRLLPAEARAAGPSTVMVALSTMEALEAAGLVRLRQVGLVHSRLGAEAGHAAAAAAVVVFVVAAAARIALAPHPGGVVFVGLVASILLLPLEIKERAGI